MEFEKLFIGSKGQPIIYKDKEVKMIDRIKVSDGSIKIKINFLNTDSKWKQGITIKTAGYFEVNNQKILNKMILWEHTSPKEVELIVESRDKILTVYNVWETEDGTTHYWHNGGAMYTEEKERERIYSCNDGFPDDDFNDLIFAISW